MMNTTDYACGVLDWYLDKEATSKVPGRRNYFIEVYDNQIIYAGGYGKAISWGRMSNTFLEIIKHNIRYYEFTYKKDFLECIDKLVANGVELVTSIG